MVERCDFRLAIVKGLVEHNDGTYYFGSTAAYNSHYHMAYQAGLVTIDKKVTDAGVEAYSVEKLDKLPKTGRAYAWDWSKPR